MHGSLYGKTAGVVPAVGVCLVTIKQQLDRQGFYPVPAGSDTAWYRIPADDRPVPCIRTVCKRPCCGPFPLNAPARERRSSSEIPREPA